MPAPTDLRKQRGAWYTPPELIDIVVDGVLDGFTVESGWPVTVVDPACGDGRFLTAVGDRIVAAGGTPELVGCDIDRGALDSIADARIRRVHADALVHDWDGSVADIVIGNPPFLSQMASGTTRGGSSRHGGGPYADAAVEFLALAVRLARPDGGRVGLVLPQSVLGARDAEPVRRAVGDAADLVWSWWSPSQRHFDASVNVCAIGLHRPSSGPTPPSAWTGVVTERLGVPVLDLATLASSGTLGDRADLNANFRDEYYALVPAVGDDVDGPPLVTSGLIDPGVCHWGNRPVRFAKRDFDRPRVDLGKLTGRFPAWAARKLVPKVLVANQTRIIEAVADPDGAWLPGVPVTTVTPASGHDVWEVAAVLTSPVASIAAWQHGAGTGLSTTSVRIGPASLAATPWPSGSLDTAVAALRAGRLTDVARGACDAFGLDRDLADDLVSWWVRQLPGDRS
jgi:N-6 DNA Methylase